MLIGPTRRPRTAGRPLRAGPVPRQAGYCHGQGLGRAAPDSDAGCRLGPDGRPSAAAHEAPSAGPSPSQRCGPRQFPPDHHDGRSGARSAVRLGRESDREGPGPGGARARGHGSELKKVVGVASTGRCPARPVPGLRLLRRTLPGPYLTRDSEPGPGPGLTRNSDSKLNSSSCCKPRPGIRRSLAWRWPNLKLYCRRDPLSLTRQ